MVTVLESNVRGRAFLLALPSVISVGTTPNTLLFLFAVVVRNSNNYILY